MLSNIHIQNFRCFEDFKAEGFERINLIGGKNNSGKTCLLEGIGTLSNKYSFNDIIFSRGELSSKYKNINNINGYFQIIAKLYNNLKIEIKEEVISSPYPKNGNLEMFFILTDKEFPKIDMVISFDSFKEKTIKNIVKILQYIDNRIENIRTYNTKHGLWIKKINEDDDQPLEFYGDAVKKVIKYFTPFFEKSLLTKPEGFTSYLLIDEIENGLHYTAHHDFWKSIFKLSKELNVQVFATTHSLEMIKAFNEVAKEEGEGAYFEMMRNENTQKINALKHSTEILEEELLENNTVRGEKFKEKIILTDGLIKILNDAATNAQQNLKDKNIPVPFIREGWLWQTMPNGVEEKIEKLQSLFEHE